MSKVVSNVMREGSPGGGREGGGAGAALVAVKAVHTLAWFSIEACMVYVLAAGLAGRSDRRAALAGAVVAGECAVFAANGFRCPLTGVAERLGAERGSVTDIYLPDGFARNLPAMHVPLVAAAVLLHFRNLRRARGGVAGSNRAERGRSLIPWRTGRS